MNDNGGKYRVPPATPTGQRFSVLASRGRPNPATSAVDLVLRPGEEVRAVLTGTVVEAQAYALYGRYPDARLRIRSAEDPSLVVTMLHVTGLRVGVGDKVMAGKTVVADHATSFPFVSQIDNYLDGRPRPHVHVEARRG